MWCEVTSQLGGVVTPKTILVKIERTLDVPESCNGVARFSFEYRCGRPVGAADYIAIANNYHTVFISDIPAMSMCIRDKARRFITLIDELYNHHCRLFCSAACSIDDLFQGTEEGTLFDLESLKQKTEGAKLRRDVLAEGNVGGSGSPTGIISLLSGQEEMFAFRRAVSRLFSWKEFVIFILASKDLENDHERTSRLEHLLDAISLEFSLVTFSLLFQICVALVLADLSTVREQVLEKVNGFIEEKASKGTKKKSKKGSKK